MFKTTYLYYNDEAMYTLLSSTQYYSQLNFFTFSFHLTYAAAFLTKCLLESLKNGSPNETRSQTQKHLQSFQFSQFKRRARLSIKQSRHTNCYEHVTIPFYFINWVSLAFKVGNTRSRCAWGKRSSIFQKHQLVGNIWKKDEAAIFTGI